MNWHESINKEIHTMSEDLERAADRLGIPASIEDLREEYERAEIATAQSISAQVAMGNYKAGM